jgi:kynureninase
LAASTAQPIKASPMTPPRADDLARHYSRFRVSERLLLTGHSHQAWPDVAFDAQQQAWLDAAEHVDRKWGERAYPVAERVRAGWRRLLGDPDGEIALGQNTHELVVRFLSALPHRDRPRLVTTDGEFHTLRRQLDRLGEEGVEVVKVAARPVSTLSERLAARIDDRSAAALVSAVLFETAEIVPHLAAVQEACTRHGAELLVDAYHHLNVVPFDVARLGLGAAFVTGGGYKYCQLGEGNCFLRVPPDRDDLRPVITGWFAEFAELEAGGKQGAVRYGRGADRWAGATYDPTAHYRAAAVFDFFESQGLTPEHLRAVSQHQVRLLAARCAEAPLAGRVRMLGVEGVGLDGVAGFLALEVDDPAAVELRLRERGVRADHRGSVLRLGPAPYLTDGQLKDTGALLAESLS